MAIDFTAKNEIRKIEKLCFTPIRFAGLLIVFFMCIAAANGFCKGKPENPIKEVDDLSKKFDAFEKTINGRLEDIEARLEGENKSVSAEPEQLVPVSQEIIERIEDGGNTQEESSDSRADSTVDSGSDTQTPVVIKPEKSNAPETIPVLGEGSLDNKKIIVDFIMGKDKKNPPAISREEVETLIDLYFEEAGKAGINPDLAIAQMCWATKFLRNKQTTITHNYAGFNTSTPGWDGKFRSKNGMTPMKVGVLAHIQHLMGYATTVRPNPEEVVDPRWNALDSFRGKIKTLEELSKRWSPGSTREYETAIKRIIGDMYRLDV